MGLSHDAVSVTPIRCSAPRFGSTPGRRNSISERVSTVEPLRFEFDYANIPRLRIVHRGRRGRTSPHGGYVECKVHVLPI